MAIISGIKINLETANQWWAPSADALFLGVHGQSGGREFRLNNDVQFNQADNEFVLRLGQPCCDTDGVLLNWSQGGGDLDPMLNPIELSTVEHVYLRKETADSTSTNDDVLVFTQATILFCDTQGNMRRFRKAGEINFSDETGLQHWLREVPAPYCEISIHLHKIEQESIGKKPAGRRWLFDFGYGIDTAPTFYENVLSSGDDDPGSSHKEPIKTRDYFELHLDLPTYVATFEGCCGQTVTLQFTGRAEQTEFISTHDIGWNHEFLNIPCGSSRTTTSHALSFTVEGANDNRKSKITFHFTVSSICRP